jgi:hypothetical protein
MCGVQFRAGDIVQPRRHGSKVFGSGLYHHTGYMHAAS